MFVGFEAFEICGLFCSIWQDLSMVITERARVVQIQIQMQTNQQCTTIALTASTVVSLEKEINQKVPFDSIYLCSFNKEKTQKKVRKRTKKTTPPIKFKFQ